MFKIEYRHVSGAGDYKYSGPFIVNADSAFAAIKVFFEVMPAQSDITLITRMNEGNVKL